MLKVYFLYKIMLYLIFSLVIALLVYNVVSISNKNKTQQKRIEKLEDKIK